MNIFLTGANGYIGQRILPVLVQEGHEVYASVRDKNRLALNESRNKVQILEIDLLEDPSTYQLPIQIDIAFYLVHSMSGKGDFEEKELLSARNFLKLLQPTQCRQIIYLSGITNSDELSKHLNSRLAVEKELSQSGIPLTILRAGIIVGSGSASFEIIRDLVEKLPVMVAPKWLNTLCQPIGVRNVIQFLRGVMGKEKYFNKTFDIGGPDVLTYKEMLIQFGEVRGLKRWIYTLPVMTPKLSSYWLFFITSTSYSLAVNLVNSMKIDVVAEPNNLAKELGIELLSYKEAVSLAFRRIEQHMVVSSWKDAFVASNANNDLMKYVQVPGFGCFKDEKSRTIDGIENEVIDQIWSIGGKKGWFYADLLWKIRGYMDKLAGGVGLRRGRTSERNISPGDALDFWRVLVADKEEGRLLLFAEMKLPGDAWLEFSMVKKDGKSFLKQTATFRPLGLWGRIYWYSVLPAHFFVFDGMINNIVLAARKVKGI